MGDLVGKRFFEVLEKEITNLKDKDGYEINPTGIKKESEEEKMWFGESYVYSLAGLCAAMDHLQSYYKDISVDDKSRIDESRFEFFLGN